MDDDEGARYPRAWAALLRLLGEPESDLADDGGEAALDISDDHASSLASPIGGFTIGPSIMRATPDVRRPPPEPPGAVTDDEAPSEAKFDDLVEMVLVGGEDGAPPSVHLMFKSDVFGGMILNLERRPEGLFARFQVPDASTRRAVLGRIDDLLVRLRARGLRIAGHEVVVQPIGELG